MPTLDFKGKSLVYAHHLTVPFRPLEPDAAKSLPPPKPGAISSKNAPKSGPKSGKPSLDDNLIIHGDNLHALKALMPRYAGRVNCIYIDPPYNTGNEKWVYNDNVNSPMMKEWLKGKSPVDGEDLERHDKWLCMMWPRLHLLRELLSDEGGIFISIDDNEIHRLRMMMDDIFGEENFIAQIVAQTNPRGRSLGKNLALTYEYILFFAKDAVAIKINEVAKSEKSIAEYNQKDEKGYFRLLRLRNTGIQFFNRQTRPNLFFPIFVNPHSGRVSLDSSREFNTQVLPLDPGGKEGCWTWGKDKIERNINLLIGKSTRLGKWRIHRKDYLPETGGTTKEKSLWVDKEINHEIGKETVTDIFGDTRFDYPKSPALIKKAINLVCGDDSVILDSFAGSATTAHAVLALNKEDNGNRKFILVECEDYADKTTAERIRRVIKGIPKAKNENLKNGLAGSFTYCTLGEEINIENMLKGKNLPTYETLARHIFWTATGQSADKINPKTKRGKDGFFYETKDKMFYLIYEPKLAFLRSSESALNSTCAERISKQTKAKKQTAIVFATHKFLGQKELSAMGIVFCGLPYGITQLVR